MFIILFIGNDQYLKKKNVKHFLKSFEDVRWLKLVNRKSTDEKNEFNVLFVCRKKWSLSKARAIERKERQTEQKKSKRENSNRNTALTLLKFAEKRENLRVDRRFFLFFKKFFYEIKFDKVVQRALPRNSYSSSSTCCLSSRIRMFVQKPNV